MSEADKKYKIEIYFDKGTGYSTEVSEEEKNNFLKKLEEHSIERVSFNDDIKNEKYIVNINNANVIKIRGDIDE